MLTHQGTSTSDRPFSFVCEGIGIDFLPLVVDRFGGFGVQAEVALHEVSKDALLLRGLCAPPAIHLRQRLQTAILRGVCVARQILHRITPWELEDEDGDGCADNSQRHPGKGSTFLGPHTHQAGS